MRIQKLGSRFLRVVTPDRQVHYFTTPGLSSLRVFWIFRNFSNIDDRVLSARQMRLVRRICNGTEISRGSVDFDRLIGTIELSTIPDQGWTRSKSLAMTSPVQLPPSDPEIADSQTVRIPSTVVSATAVVVCLLAVVTVLADAAVRHHIAAVVSRSFKSMASMLPRAPQESNLPQQAAAQSVPEPSLVKPALPVHDQNKVSNAQLADSARSDVSSLFGTEQTAELRPATLRVASLNEPPALPIRNLQSEGSAMAEPRSITSARPVPRRRAAAPEVMAEALPPSGPPQSHPVPDDFPEVAKDTKVVLRAIVTSDGKVARVHVIEGNPALAREAARAVTSWRYSPRANSGDAESHIVFQFAPDVTTVSFLNSGPAKIAR